MSIKDMSLKLKKLRNITKTQPGCVSNVYWRNRFYKKNVDQTRNKT